jgi:hypothetical protein
VKRFAAFAAACLTIIGLAGLVLFWIYGDAASRRALWIGGLIAFVVQLATFAAARLMARRNPVAGWGIGVVIRFVVLAVYGLVGARALDLPLTPALLSTATFLFLSTLVEPLFLQP